MRYIQWIKIISVLAIFGILIFFGYHHLGSIKTVGIALLATLLTFIEWWIPLPFSARNSTIKKTIPWTQAFAWAMSIWVVIGFAVWLPYK